MNILINLSTLKKGGGQNVGLNFLYGLFKIDDQTNNYFFLVVKDSEIHKYILKINCTNIITTSYSPTKRILNEIFKHSALQKKIKIDIVYTYFGYGMFTKKIPQVCGIAVSNVLFPEIKFWEGNYFKIFLRKIVDIYRIFGIKNATALIFENKTLEERSHSIFNIPPDKTIYIPPSFNPHFEKTPVKLPEFEKYTTKMLMLCGWQLNKNIMKVPEIAYHLKKTNQSFHFIITAPKNYSKEHLEFIQLQEKFKVSDMISIIGPVLKQHLENLYSQIDFVLLMSKLESFSNSIIESWYFGKPLVISDAQWAKGICRDAAFYVNRDSSEQIADDLVSLKNSPKIQSELIKNGFLQLNQYPSIEEKTKQEISFLVKIYNDVKGNN